MAPDGTVSTLHEFTGSPPDGGFPTGPVIQASDGNLWGGVANGFGGFRRPMFNTITYGGVFAMTLSGAFAGPWRSFNGGNGGFPHAPVVQATDGNIYGTTTWGSDINDYRLGAVFRLTPASVLTAHHKFLGGPNDGAYPGNAPLIQASDGNLYGTTERGGAFDRGTIFRMTLAGAVTVLRSFTGGADGHTPKGGVIQANDGTFYGTASSGGKFNKGVVFRLGAVPFSFSDDPVVARSSTIRAVHVIELRTIIDVLRARHGLGDYASYTDPEIKPGVAMIRAQHIIEMRAALAEAYSAAGQRAAQLHNDSSRWRAHRRRRH